MRLLIAVVFVFATGITQATEDQLKFKDAEQEQLYLELIKELRCPKCQNQNIADSNAVVAKDMRVKTKELVENGNDKQQVVDYMVDRYGQFAHYQPPINWATSLLWLLPILFILSGVWLLTRRSRDEKQTVVAEKSVSEDQELDKELASLLEQAQQDEKSQGDK